MLENKRKNGHIKISFTGDVMCEAVQIQAHYKKGQGYEFNEIFNDVKEYFSKSDYVVANLETPLAGEAMGYANKKFSFNTPEEFASAVKECGVNLVTTANNHCLDRGTQGLCKTIDTLDKIKLQHIGTYKDRGKSYHIQDIQGIRVGFLSYTYGTNAFTNRQYLDKNQQHMVDLFQKQELSNFITRICYNNPNKLFSKIYRKSMRVLYPTQARRPVYERKESSWGQLRKLKKDIKECRTDGADYIIMCMHMGGQYNSEPTQRTKKLADKIIQYGADTIIGNHEHVIHKCDMRKLNENIVKTYSLGNFTGLAGVMKEPYDKLAEYSIVLNVFLNKVNRMVKVEKCTFSIMKSIKISHDKVKTVLLYDLINECDDECEKNKLINDNAIIVQKFLDRKVEVVKIEREYLCN